MLEGGNQGETDAVPSGHDLRGVAVLGDMREGTIFVRKVGKTEPATAADIDRLTERARRVGMSLTLDLHVLAPVKTLDPIFLSEEFREEQLGKRRAQLQASLPAPSSGLLASIDRLTPGENRTRDRFIAEIDRFVDDAEREWDTLVAVKELEHDPSKLRLELVNESDDNFSDVVLEVTLPLARAQVHLSGSEARSG